MWPTKDAVAVRPDHSGRPIPLRAKAQGNEEFMRCTLMYGFLYVGGHSEEGWVIVGTPDLNAKRPGVGTLLDGYPANNFPESRLTFNPDGRFDARAAESRCARLVLRPDHKSLVVWTWNIRGAEVTPPFGSSAVAILARWPSVRYALWWIATD